MISGDVEAMLEYCTEVCQTLITHRSFRHTVRLLLAYWEADTDLLLFVGIRINRRAVPEPREARLPRCVPHSGVPGRGNGDSPDPRQTSLC